MAGAKRKISVAVSILLIAGCIASAYFLPTKIIPLINYNKAVKLKDAGKYEEAISAFEALGGYSDSADQIALCGYGIAEELMNSGRYGEAISARLESMGIRTSVDNRNEKIGYKIRQAQLEKIPYFFIVGDNEVQDNTVALRSRKDGDLGATPLEDVIARIIKENAEKTR